MAQVSSSNHATPVQMGHIGMFHAFSAYNSGGNKTPFSGSVSDSIVVLTMPRNSTIIAAYLGGFSDDGNYGFSLGDPGLSTRYGTVSISGTAHAIRWFDGATNFAYSVSDDQNTYKLTLHLQDATSVSGSMSVHVGVLYRRT